MARIQSEKQEPGGERIVPEENDNFCEILGIVLC